MCKIQIKGISFSHAVFDVDGVLANSFIWQYNAFAAVLALNKTYGASRRTLAERFIDRFDRAFNYDDFRKIASGKKRIAQIEDLFNHKKDLSPEEISEISRLKDDFYQKFLRENKITRYEEMVPLLKKLENCDISTAFVSGSTSAAKVLKNLGLLGYFTAGIFPDPTSTAAKGQPNAHICVRPQVPDSSNELGVKIEHAGMFLTKPNEIAYIMGARQLPGYLNQPFLVFEDSSEVAQTLYNQMRVIYIGPENDLDRSKSTHAILCFEEHSKCAEQLINALNSQQQFPLNNILDRVIRASS